MADTDVSREAAFGQEGRITGVDRAGVWLSGHQIRRAVGSLEGKDVGDFGCGFQATYMRTVLDEVRSATLVDISLTDDLKSRPNVTAIEGKLPGVLQDLPDRSLDVILCMSVLEHLWEPGQALTHFRRLVRPGGVLAINVPSWRGKRALEFSAFRLGLSPATEMDDHKRYYDPRDLWPLLVTAGFVPHGIRCFRHKFGLNTFAVCKVDPVGS
ncbi:MAG: methyltransferase domain-containing protein [Streptosporangiaceae bacterium]|jgi:SAM-dependent methyltransferase